MRCIGKTQPHGVTAGRACPARLRQNPSAHQQARLPRAASTQISRGLGPSRSPAFGLAGRTACSAALYKRVALPQPTPARLPVEVESSLMGRFFPDLAALRLGFSWGHIARPLQATAAIRPVQTGNGTAFTRWPGRVHRECINDTASEPRSWATHATPIRDFAVRRVPVCRVLFLPDVPHGAIPRFIPKLIDSITPSTRTTVSNNL
jgi:hypothetical protein